jgi:dipeptidyl aminopeptidase/acylaminoacyl peptidase
MMNLPGFQNKSYKFVLLKSSSMKKAILLLLHSLFILNTNAQLLDKSLFDKWPFVSSPSITNDGKYVAYIINGGRNQGKTLSIQSVSNTNQKKTFTDVQTYNFHNNSHQIFVLNKKDSLVIYHFENDKMEVIPQVKSYQLISNNNQEWLLYYKKEDKNPLILKNLQTRLEWKINNVNNYKTDSNILVLEKSFTGHDELTYFDISTLQERFIFKYQQIENVILSKNGRKAAFTTTDNSDNKSIWYYEMGEKMPCIIATDDTSGTGQCLRIDRIEKFSTDNNNIFINFKKPGGIKAAKPDIWSSSDKRLLSQQTGDLKENRSYLGTLNIRDHSLLLLEKEYETLFFLNERNDKWAAIKFQEGDTDERNWNPASKEKDYLVDCSNGNRKEVDIILQSISPDGKFIIGTDSTWNNFLSYELTTGKIQQLSSDLPGPEKRNLFFAGWQKEDGGLLIYDDFDIWKIDLRHTKRIINLTNGYGRKNNIVLRIANTGDNEIYNKMDIQLLSGFNCLTKDNGYFHISAKDHSDPVLLTMGKYYFNQPLNTALSDFYPVKAARRDIWIVRRENAASAPNYYSTVDFKSFTPISNVHPESSYNWYTTELINFESLDGKHVQGILYKPQNFDSSNKYPVIVNIYEKLSDKLNIYQKPDRPHDNINIPWLVNHGYIIFTPDIAFTIGEPGKSACNSVLGGLNYLSKLKYIDTANIGIQGHSYGAFEINYIITHTNRFKAAISAAGASNMLSLYGGIWPSGYSKQGGLEIGQYRIGCSLWENTQRYIENSPVLFADKVETPVLLINNKEDGAVPFSQGIEFFTALRRSGKKAWLLQYDDEGHSLHGKNTAEDYMLKIDQFFGHYLKNIPAADWMSNGIKPSPVIPPGNRGYQY